MTSTVFTLIECIDIHITNSFELMRSGDTWHIYSICVDKMQSYIDAPLRE